MAVIGDTQATAQAAIVVAMPQSIVPTADVADKTNAVNIALLSGKKGGATIVVDTAGAFEIYVAQGGTDVAAWISTDGVTTITPA
jgi:hypothetical protein